MQLQKNLRLLRRTATSVYAEQTRIGPVPRYGSVRSTYSGYFLQISKIGVDDPDPDPEEKMTHKKVKKFYFFKCFSCSSDVL